MIVGERVNSSSPGSFFALCGQTAGGPHGHLRKSMPMNPNSMTLTAHRQAPLLGQAPLLALLALVLTALSAALPGQLARAGVDLPTNANSKPATGLAAALHTSAEPDFLPPDQAFRFSALPDGPDSIRLIWGVTDGYYLYRARIKASSDTTQAKLGDL